MSRMILIAAIVVCWASVCSSRVLTGTKSALSEDQDSQKKNYTLPNFVVRARSQPHVKIETHNNTIVGLESRNLVIVGPIQNTTDGNSKVSTYEVVFNGSAIISNVTFTITLHHDYQQSTNIVFNDTIWVKFFDVRFTVKVTTHHSTSTTTSSEPNDTSVDVTVSDNVSLSLDDKKYSVAREVISQHPEAQNKYIDALIKKFFAEEEKFIDKIFSQPNQGLAKSGSLRQQLESANLKRPFAKF